MNGDMSGRGPDRQSHENKRKPGPPCFARAMIDLFTSSSDKQTIAGDLEEYFHEISSQRGRRAACRAYRWEVLCACARLIANTARWKVSMLRSYLVLAMRNLGKDRVYSLINVFGLALGFACSFLIALWVTDEVSFDRYHAGHENIYRVNYLYGAEEEPNVWTQVLLADALKSDLAPVTDAAFAYPLRNRLTVRCGDKSFLEEHTLISDHRFFDIFTVEFVRGSARTALTRPNTAVLTRSTARKYFGMEEAMGRTIALGTSGSEYEVTGVIEDCPENSHLQYGMIFTNDWEGYGWGSNSVLTYIRLAGGYSSGSLQPLMQGFIERTFAGRVREAYGMSIAEFMDDPVKKFRFGFQPLASIHLSPGISDNVSLRGNLTHVYIFSLVSLLILIMASINFINLSTARAGKRAKEVGVRKVAGADRKMLVRQFLFESVLSSSLSFALSVILINLVIPRFNSLTGKTMAMSDVLSPVNLGLLLAVSVLSGLLAGIYPAFYLSSFKPAAAVKSGPSGGTFRSRTRDILVVFQYTIATVIFLSAFVIYSQSRYLTSARLGFDKDRVLVVHRARLLGERLGSFIEELGKIPGVEAVSSSSSMPGRHFNPNGHRLEGMPASEEKTIFTMYSDSRFADVFGVKLSRGRFFSDEIGSDSNSAVVVNEAAVAMLGLDEPLGKRFHKDFGGAGEGEFVTIIGVVEDFNFHSLHNAIQPMVIRNLGDDPGYYVSLRLGSFPGDAGHAAAPGAGYSGTDPAAIVEGVRKAWAVFAEEGLFEYSFLESDFDALYRSEMRTGRIMSTFFVLSIVIACLGLFGLVSYSAEQRTKEIGIRKVLGASINDIIVLLSGRITLLVVIANIIAWPVSYLIMERWLDNFAYRTDFHLWLPALSTSVGLALALITVGYRAVKAARANPVENIRYE